MGEIVIFAGTSEGRRLSEWLCANAISHEVCVATEYGEQILTENQYAHIKMGRMNCDEMQEYFKVNRPKMVIDATHPYAEEVTKNIKTAAEIANVKYCRLLRESLAISDYENIEVFPDSASCNEACKNTSGNIMLTTGSKELKVFCADPEVKERLVVRVLPGSESIGLCETNGIDKRRIIAMQGPFSHAMNLALIKEYNIEVLVTKESGKAGGFEEKISAAQEAGITTFVIGRPVKEEGKSFSEICDEIEKAVNKTTDKALKVSLVGCGMGSIKGMTIEAYEAVKNADIIFGAERLLTELSKESESYPYYLAKDIIPILKTKSGNAVVLFSGDTGFYSGAAKMKKALLESNESGEMSCEIEVLPGISSVSYLASKLGISWEDSRIISVHGRGNVLEWGESLLECIGNNRKTFVLVSGAEDVRTIGKLLIDAGLENVKVTYGYRLSYDDEIVKTVSLNECQMIDKQGLYCLMIEVM